MTLQPVAPLAEVIADCLRSLHDCGGRLRVIEEDFEDVPVFRQRDNPRIADACQWLYQRGLFLAEREAFNRTFVFRLSPDGRELWNRYQHLTRERIAQLFTSAMLDPLRDITHLPLTVSNGGTGATTDYTLNSMVVFERTDAQGRVLASSTFHPAPAIPTATGTADAAPPSKPVPSRRGRIIDLD